MPPHRPQYTQESIDQHLQQIHLLDQSSSSENLEQLGPIIKQIHTNRQQEVYLRTLQGLIESKDAEIERICGENYRDFISSVSTLFSIKSHTTVLSNKISSLDASVSQVGHGLVEKKRALLQCKKTAANLDEAIDTLQACLRVLDVVHRVGEMVKERKYWSALRSLEDIQSMPPTSLSQTPLFQHLVSSLPSLRTQIKDAVTASTKQWLWDIRNVSGQVGKLAIEAMDTRTRRWRSRRERDPMTKHSKVGNAVELVTYEKTEFDVFDNSELKVDFKPLYHCIHIYTALDSLDELRKSYQADRRAQSDLILPNPIPLSALSSIIQEIAGFFIVETHVLKTAGNFRSEQELEELWDSLLGRLCLALDVALSTETDPEGYLRVKEALIGFIMTMETYEYPTTGLHSFILILFEKYSNLLEKQFGKRFRDIVERDDSVPMQAENEQERNAIMNGVWLVRAERERLLKQSFPLVFPWSQCFYLCCDDVNHDSLVALVELTLGRQIRNFVKKFYHFIEGVAQHHRNIDELLSKSLDTLLSAHISGNIAQRANSVSNLSELAQIAKNIEHFEVCCAELARSLTNIRAVQRGGVVHILTASGSFSKTLGVTLDRIPKVISKKVDDLLSEYEWTPREPEGVPTPYLSTLFQWLTTVIDSLALDPKYKDKAYEGATAYINDFYMDMLTSRANMQLINQNALENVLVDIKFLKDQYMIVGLEKFTGIFDELVMTASIPVNEQVAQYQEQRQTKFALVKPRKLQMLLEKLARYGSTRSDRSSRELAEKRRKEAEILGRIYPGESR
ncbi:exocyst complex component sec15 subunit [Thelephora ganbajun]|uniref:Exocyst complex component sec15 subunit n=1 Tax=Thelephora ganbajun TaxID=370292 RepID=A0ACB6ZIT6_THEGA|nr:exocyst complex component sec15 subunit [Thelephora ganbajun]